MAHFRLWVKWSGHDDEAMRIACHTALDDILREMKRKAVEPEIDKGNRKLELIVNAGGE